MAGGKIRHWKHGWIPISPEAKAFVAGRGPRPVSTDVHPPKAALERAKARQAAWKAQQAAKRAREASATDVKSTNSGSFRITRVDGYPDVHFKEVLELDRRPPEQYREVAKTVTDVLKPYPRATSYLDVEVGFSNELPGSVMADTNDAGVHKIRVNVNMWDRPGDTMAKAEAMRERNFGMTGQAGDLEQFRRNVITHEVGHLIHMRDEDEAHKIAGSPDVKGAIEQFAQEPVTPRQMGYQDGQGQLRNFPDADYFPQPRNPDINKDVLDQQVPRWMADSLGRRSAYALSNQFEFFAEAFLDGTINGDKASESGKRAVQIAAQQFGPGSPSVRERLYGKAAS
jgi:hypothetical protein